MSPSVSVSAFFASIMPAPVLSRRSFTMLAVTAMIGLLGMEMGMGLAG